MNPPNHESHSMGNAEPHTETFVDGGDEEGDPMMPFDSDYDNIAALITRNIETDYESSHFPETDTMDPSNRQVGSRFWSVPRTIHFPQSFHKIFRKRSNYGILEDIFCIWAYADKTFALWNFESGEVITYHGFEFPVTAVAVFPSRSEFQELASVHFFLVAANTIEINLLGIHFENGRIDRKQMKLIRTQYFLNLNGSIIQKIAVTKEGHIFLVNKECEVSEFVYGLPTNESQFPCREIFTDRMKALRPIFNMASKLINPAYETDAPLSFVTDDDKCLLYMLTKKGHLQVYSINKTSQDGSLSYLCSFDVTTRLNPMRPVDIVELFVINETKHETDLGHFVIVCNDSTRMYYTVKVGGGILSKYYIALSHIIEEESSRCVLPLCSKNTFVFATNENRKSGTTTFRANFTERDHDMVETSALMTNPCEIRNHFTINDEILQVRFANWEYITKGIDASLWAEWRDAMVNLEHNTVAHYAYPTTHIFALGEGCLYVIRKHSLCEEFWINIRHEEINCFPIIEELSKHYGFLQVLSAMLGWFHLIGDNLPYSITHSQLDLNKGEDFFRSVLGNLDVSLLSNMFGIDSMITGEAAGILFSRMNHYYWTTPIFEPYHTGVNLVISESLLSTMRNHLSSFYNTVGKSPMNNNLGALTSRSVQLVTFLNNLREYFPQLNSAARDVEGKTLSDILLMDPYSFAHPILLDICSNIPNAVEQVYALNGMCSEYCPIEICKTIEGDEELRYGNIQEALQVLSQASHQKNFDIAHYCRLLRTKGLFKDAFILALTRLRHLHQRNINADDVLAEIKRCFESFFIDMSTHLTSSELNAQMDFVDNYIISNQINDAILFLSLTEALLDLGVSAMDKVIERNFLINPLVYMCLSKLNEAYVTYETCERCAYFLEKFYVSERKYFIASQHLFEIARKESKSGDIETRNKLIRRSEYWYNQHQTTTHQEQKEFTENEAAFHDVLQTYRTVLEVQFLIVQKHKRINGALLEERSELNHRTFSFRQLLDYYTDNPDFADICVVMIECIRSDEQSLEAELGKIWASTFAGRGFSEVKRVIELFYTDVWSKMKMGPAGQKSLLEYIILNFDQELAEIVVEYTPIIFQYDIATNTIFNERKKHTILSHNELAMQIVLSIMEKLYMELQDARKLASRGSRAPVGYKERSDVLSELVKQYRSDFGVCQSAELVRRFKTIDRFLHSNA